MKKSSILLCACTLMSCYHVYYAPNTPNPPLFKEKGEMRINAYYAAGGDTDYDGAELQAAYALSNNWGLMLNTFTASHSEFVTEDTESGSGTYVEAGAGYFKAMDEKGKWRMEIYGGLGTGKVENNYSWNDFSKVGITKLFLQPAIGYRGRYFEFAFVPRLVMVNWKVKEVHLGHSTNEWVNDDMAAIRSKPVNISFEPAIIVRVGPKNVKLHGGLTFRNIGPYTWNDLSESLNATVGLSFTFPTRKKMKS